ncbi:MAG: hypothetical protein ACRCTW_05515 [Lactococcus garvieae]
MLFKKLRNLLFRFVLDAVCAQNGKTAQFPMAKPANLIVNLVEK